MKSPLTTSLFQTKTHEEKAIPTENYRENFKKQIIIYI
jgi:hypothetical protein